MLRRMLQPRSPAFARGAILLAALSLLSGCATKRASPAPVEAPPIASIEAAAPLLLDQRRVDLAFTLRVGNPGAAAITIEGVDYALYARAGQPTRLSSRAGQAIAGGGEAAIRSEFPIEVADLGEAIAGDDGPASAPWRLTALARIRKADGSPLELPAEASGTFPIVRDPRFRITSIKIERDLLVTTNLRLGLEIENPNEFPLELDSFDYGFYGEGRLWADGGSSIPLTVPAKGKAQRGLEFEMNFADMDRRLFDLVANLRVVRYRLAGEARIATDLAFLPAFEARFDREGSCAVDR
jgi:LEA14-like dessication related protein